MSSTSCPLGAPCCWLWAHARTCTQNCGVRTHARARAARACAWTHHTLPPAASATMSTSTTRGSMEARSSQTVAGDGWSGSQLAHVLNFHSPGMMPKENQERQPTGAELDLAGWCTRVLTLCDTEETPRTGRMVVHRVDAGSQRWQGPQDYADLTTSPLRPSCPYPSTCFEKLCL